MWTKGKIVIVTAQWGSAQLTKGRCSARELRGGISTMADGVRLRAQRGYSKDNKKSSNKSHRPITTLKDRNKQAIVPHRGCRERRCPSKKDATTDEASRPRDNPGSQMHSKGTPFKAHCATNMPSV